MKRLFILLGLALLAPAPAVFGQFTQMDQNAMLYSYRATNSYERGVNYSSARGVPGKANTFAGADGRISAQGTANQFRGVVTYGALARPAQAALQAGKNFEQNAVNLNLPRATVGSQVTLVLRASQAGAPFYSRVVSQAFGSVIVPPDSNWEAEPYTATTQDGKPYYWSPHARSVFATQPGPISIMWRKKDPATGLPGTQGVDWVDYGGLTYGLTNVNYVVSGSAVKQPRKIYWTEKSFRSTGKAVSVPTARVGAIYFHYSSIFPRTNATEFVAIGSSSVTEGSTNSTLKELRTLWYDSDQNLILAYNREGRAFMEVLGDPTGPGTRKHLGFEIVDVFQQPQAVDIDIDLGEKILAYADGRDDSALLPSANTDAVSGQYLYLQAVGGNRLDYYAVKETLNQNDVLVHWLEEGVGGLRWPLIYDRYRQRWPDDLRRYSQYIRPLAMTDAEARTTAIALPSDNAPAIQYQDPMDQPRAKLTEKIELYTVLDAAHPYHRTLLRFNAGERVAFERVFSSLVPALNRPANTLGDADMGTTVHDFATFLRPGRSSFLNLDGSTGYGQMAPGSYFSATTGFTVEGWVYLRSYKNWQRFIDFGNGPVSDNMVVSLSTGNVPVVQTYRGTSAGPQMTSPEALPLNRWVHLAVVQDAPVNGETTANTRIYINGISKAESKLSVPLGIVTTNNYFGRSNWADPYADAAFDDLRIWSVARPADAIASGMGLSYPAKTTGLVAQFGFEESGLTAFDTSGFDRDMTLAGGAAVGTDATIAAVAGGGLPALDKFLVPRLVQASATVGDRIQAPAGELGSNAGDDYLAGYIQTATGDSYHPGAYVNPFTAGFDAAGEGAIIPVNSIPGKDLLEVWWFRKNATNNIKNELNGFKPVYWPAVVAKYRLVWPSAPSEIVLASNAGSGGLESLEAKGDIYVQNDATQAGYNPNEEHALMIGGQAFALRDDLNITSGSGFSSQPFVLLNYVAADGRPSIHAFKVLREKPAAGIVFDYIFNAGTRLQAPMPLPLLAAPVELVTAGSGDSQTVTSVNYNSEPVGVGDLPINWNPATNPSGPFGHYAKFTFKDRKENVWVMRGLHGGLPTLQAGRFVPRVGSTPESWDPVVAVSAVAGTSTTNFIHASRRIESLVPSVVGNPLPSGLRFAALRDGLAVFGTAPNASDVYTLAITDGDGASATVTFRIDIGGSVKTQGPLQIVSTNQYAGAMTTYIGRPPRLADSPTPTNSFTMRFYYKTQEGFAWPGVANAPAVGAIVPYLRPAGSSADPGAKSTPSLDIVYRPVWPGNAPKLAFGETLTVPNQGKPAIRGQTSAKILYQQSIAQDMTAGNPTVALHDPTRQKSYLLTNGALVKIPDGVRSEVYQGKQFFPNLPPHLAERFFYDPNLGDKGSLILTGQFQDETLGEKYLLLNVLGAADLATCKGLCPQADPDKSAWDTALDGLATKVETFYENPRVPGQFIVNPDFTVSRGVGQLTVVTNDNTAVDSYALSSVGPGQGFVTVIVGNGAAFTPPGEPVSMYVLRVTGQLYRGEIKVLTGANPLNEQVTFQHTADLAGQFNDYEYEWKIAPPVDGFPPQLDATMSEYQPLVLGLNYPRYTLGGSGIQTLVDNYVVMRYRPKNAAHPLYSAAPSATATNWSEWTQPALAEGWIKRVLAAINPFGQRVTDLFNNTVNTDSSVLAQAGHRYEGDIALNLENINNYGLIEIYETVLKRGRGLSIDAGINFGPANDALLLAAGYLNDLYMLVGNEAYADAANPTIGIGTKDNQYGSIATALFSFKGQVPTLLDEELGLLRGRDDTMQPGVEVAPVYNRLIWNYTRGIDSGEVIYGLNYNILDQNTDGKVDAEDAAKLYPQGHGDAYGHYLTATKGYYTLLLSPSFDWVPRIEAVNILGKPVSVDYLDERKFAGSAAAAARTARQIFDLTWRKDYAPGETLGWKRFATNRVSARTVVNGTTTTNVVRFWGADHWASRAAQGALINWAVGNSILPDVDPDPSHEGIQKVDRTTVPELQELASIGSDVQAQLDAAEGRMTPLGLAQGSLAFDIDPTKLVQSNPQTHFEQVYERAKVSLNNGVSAFDDAKDITRLMRSEEDSLSQLQTLVGQQELAFTNQLVEIYGTPYPDDVGPGKTYKQGYVGPDLIHYVYVENPELTFGSVLDPRAQSSFNIDIQNLPSTWVSGGQSNESDFAFFQMDGTRSTTNFITYTLSPHGYFQKPTNWVSQRVSPGQIQQAISGIIKARNNLNEALGNATSMKSKLDSMIRVYNAGVSTDSKVSDYETQLRIAEAVTKNVERANDLFEIVQGAVKEDIVESMNLTQEALPKSLIAGLAAGGDLTSAGRAAIEASGLVITTVIDGLQIARKAVVFALRAATDEASNAIQKDKIEPLQQTQERRKQLQELDFALGDLQGAPVAINRSLQEYDDARRALASLIARGDRIQQERQVYRQRIAAVIQGYRTRDAAFRIFRNEKLERYKTLFDLASRYAFMAANAYDYETGLLNTEKGRAFVNRIISSRALGVIKNGEPQFAGSDSGDPGLSSALAEMKADWDVLRGRLGFNSPAVETTLVSFRTENLRIMPGDDGLPAWQDYLMQHKMDNILDDGDVRRYCLQANPGTGLTVPGIVINFSTTVTPGQNIFGRDLAAGDSSFHRSAFATKINSVGLALPGYRGMNNPGNNSSAINYATGSATNGSSDPTLAYLDPDALTSTPYVYLIPVGEDVMRSPPLGDESAIRTWSVDDVAIPLPFNIGGSGFSNHGFYQSADSLTEPLFAIRKHQAFRPVDSVAPFSTLQLQFSPFTSRRLIGRSVWNTQWKLVIPADALLNDPKEGLNRFIRTVKDLQLYIVTYSYSGN